MTHLRIEQAIGQTEYVSDSVVEKLYEIVTNSALDNSSNLQGTVHVNIGYRTHINSITTAYPDFHVITDAYAIPFEDPNMAAYLNSIGVGSNGMVTEAQAAAATMVANSANTTITKFNELRYFTQITQSRNGWTGMNSGFVRFYNWTALEEVDISNFTSLGHNNGASWEDTFRGCTSLKTVTASNKLTQIGFSAFDGCSNLESITGLSGDITLATNAFSGCQKLTDASFQNVTSFDFVSGVGRSLFENCKLITTIPLNSNVTSLERAVFENCSALTTIDTHNITNFGERCFMGCTSLATVDLSSCTILGDNAFTNCSALNINVTLPNLTQLGNGSFDSTAIKSVDLSGSTITSVKGFKNCSSLTSVTLPSTVTSVATSAFEGCTNLTSINLSNVTTIGAYAFKNTKLSSINLASCTSIDREAFVNNNNLTTIQNTSNVTYLGVAAFYGSKVTSLDLDFTKITSLAYGVFGNCENLYMTVNTSTINLRDGGGNLFYHSSHVTFPQTLTLTLVPGSTVGNDQLDTAFTQCDLSNTHIILDSSIKNIGKACFENSHLKQITATGVEYMSWYAFNACNCTEIILPSLIGCHEAYNNHAFGYFSNCPNLTKVVLGHFNQNVGANAYHNPEQAWFYNSPNIKYFDIGDSAPSIKVNERGELFRTSNGIISTLETYICRSTTVPTILLESGGNNYNNIINCFGGSGVHIYVPDAQLNDYKTAQYWSTIASNIYPLSDIEP